LKLEFKGSFEKLLKNNQNIENHTQENLEKFQKELIRLNYLKRKISDDSFKVNHNLIRYSEVNFSIMQRLNLAFQSFLKTILEKLI
jgi:hypothetical protein